MKSTSHLILYVNPAWRREGTHSVFMSPWWGNPYTKEAVLARQLFEKRSFDTSQYSITDDIDKADMVFAPYRHQWLLRHDSALFEECVRTAEKANIPILIDGLGDVESPINAKKYYVLRYGGYRFLHEPGRIQLPLIAGDLLERYQKGEMAIMKKAEGKPNVGFAGWAALTPKQRIRTIVKELPIRFRSLFDDRYRACTKGIFWREKAITVLGASPLVSFHGHARQTFSGNPKTAMGDQLELQKEMVDTILASDYALDVRGDANDSTRLFEILSLGRIPVVLDTERNFPFSDEIDYTSFALIVDFRDIERLPEKIAAFHKSVSSERFEAMQKNARDTYVKYFRVDALMQHVIARLSDAEGRDAVSNDYGRRV